MFHLVARVANSFALWMALVSLPATALALQAAPLIIKGSLTYRARIALPPGSRAAVEFRDAGAPSGIGVVAEQRADLKGRQVPIPYELPVDRAKLAAGKRYVVKGAIVSGARVVWASKDIAVDLSGPVVDLGTVALTQTRAETIKSELMCGADRVSVAYDQGIAHVTVGGQAYEMKQVLAASGAKYEAADDPSTSFWNKGRNGTLVVKGKTYPLCTPVAVAPSQAFSATGNEPGWRLDIVNGQLTLLTNNGATRTTLPAPKPEAIPSGRKYTASTDGRVVTAMVLDRVCHDTMTGMPRPNTVEVTIDRTILKGCGGDPAALLLGKTWVVEDIDGTPPVDNSRVTLNFGQDGRLSGNSSCNRYNGKYAITGEGLTITQTAGTMMACISAALMAQEKMFLDMLRAVQRFEMRPDGKLVLHTGKHTITARPEAPT